MYEICFRKYSLFGGALFITLDFFMCVVAFSTTIYPWDGS